jgi:monovalent cation/hydrogen antiporter
MATFEWIIVLLLGAALLAALARRIGTPIGAIMAMMDGHLSAGRFAAVSLWTVLGSLAAGVGCAYVL